MKDACGVPREVRESRGMLFTGKTGLGICSSLSGANSQEATLTLPCKSEISLFSFANSFLPCCLPQGRCPQSDSQLSINSVRLEKGKKIEIAALLVATCVIN